jgi:hypothetical protein
MRLFSYFLAPTVVVNELLYENISSKSINAEDCCDGGAHLNFLDGLGGNTGRIQ